MTRIYLIGSLRNPNIPGIGNNLRDAGYEVFDDWFAGGKIADDEWQAYEQTRGRTYSQALVGYAARHVYDFDLKHLDRADIGLLVLPAGKSGHLELGYLAGRGKDTFVYFPDGEPERWDVMYQFCTGWAFDWQTLVNRLPGPKNLRAGPLLPGSVVFYDEKDGPPSRDIFYDPRDQVWRDRVSLKELKVTPPQTGEPA